MLVLQVEVPIACFRQSRAREYAETYSVPPPSTIYGMLLSVVGEMDRYKHCGTQLAIALLSTPQKSTVIRTFRRFKKKELGDPVNARPDYQELLTDIQLLVYVALGTDSGTPALLERLKAAFARPETINRFGGLCLGESRDLVNAITPVEQISQDKPFRWLVKDEDGLLTLPYWVDHLGSRNTRWLRYLIQETPAQWQPPETAWTTIKSS